MRVAINKCYGGFSLSPRAVKRLAELRGLPCYFFSVGDAVHKPITMEEAEKAFVWFACSVPDTLASREATDIDIRPENRSDPLLLQVIDELGEAANGPYAKIAIVEIPDNVEYEIKDYEGGKEQVAEKHRVWA